jgi:hypothetical protein
MSAAADAVIAVVRSTVLVLPLMQRDKIAIRISKKITCSYPYCREQQEKYSYEARCSGPEFHRLYLLISRECYVI